MISKIVHVSGVILLILFSMICVFLSTTMRDLPFSTLQKVSTYPSSFEDRFYDFRAKLMSDPDKKTKELILADIDDEALHNIGRWPFTRTVWKDLLHKLKNYGAKVVLFDVFYSEPERYCNSESPDKIFADAIGDFQSMPGNKVVFSYSVNPGNDPTFEMAPDSLLDFVMDAQQVEGTYLVEKLISKTTYPLPILLEKEVGLGNIGVLDDPDGIFRHYPVISNVDGLYFPSFALLGYRYLTGDNPSFEMLAQGHNVVKFKTGDLHLNDKGEAKIRWLGDSTHFPRVSVHRIISSPNDDAEMKEIFAGNAVFVGPTAVGAHDLRHSPVDPKLPGVFFHMNALHMFLTGNFFKPKNDSAMISWGLLIGGTLLMILIQLAGHAIIDLFAVIFISAGMFFYDINFLLPVGHEIKLFFILFSIISSYSWTTFINFYRTAKEKKMIKGTFSRYVAPAIVEQMLDNPEKLKVGGEKKNITVIFSDVRDFTSISEKLSATQLSSSLNRYMGIMTDILFDTYGTLDKYIGDALVGYWGAPVEVENHAYHGVRGALQMIETLPKINAEFKREGLPEFKIGIGLNTGECSVGNMGSDKIFSYTALGDHMNLGSRLEGLCKFYGCQLIISEYTHDQISEEMRNDFTFRILDKVKVKGKEQAVTIYEVLHSTHPFNQDREALKSYLQAFDFYLNQQFDEALELLTPLVEKYPADKSSARMKDVCQEYIAQPPGEGWDGVTVYKQK